MNATALSVNVNKVALLRNTRHLGEPSVTRAATDCLTAGAHGITVHPRPDERHIRASDVADLAAILNDWPGREYNIEGNPFQNLMGFIRQFRPHQATFVPDGEDQFTSDHGWDIAPNAAMLKTLIAECHDLGVRVSLFMDPDPEAMALAREVGADRVELYTETFASHFLTPFMAQTTSSFTATALAAHGVGLGVNAGHDLNLHNLPTFIAHVPHVREVSIGHAYVGDALGLGWRETTAAYLNAIHSGARQGASRGI